MQNDEEIVPKILTDDPIYSEFKEYIAQNKDNYARISKKDDSKEKRYDDKSRKTTDKILHDEFSKAVTEETPADLNAKIFITRTCILGINIAK